jgi:hypothetical protein
VAIFVGRQAQHVDDEISHILVVERIQPHRGNRTEKVNRAPRLCPTMQ